MITSPTTSPDSSSPFSRVVRRIFLATLALLLLVYLGDFLWF
ncbi:MAG TPA: hypothetical protein VKA02_14130 [Candidatus Acidoferrum sp.]|nr:hypothetical protein [Candidatus Acidoferrum sp.]